MKRILPFFPALLLLFSGCGFSSDTNSAPVSKYQAEFLGLFDTVTVIAGYSESEEHFKSFAQEVYNELEEYHKLYDIYNSYEGINNLKTINDNV
jgi:thiamine biosynthesis lipoprotein